MAGIEVTSTEFQNSFGKYLADSATKTVRITRHNRECRVLINAEEYDRLAALDTRLSLYPHELPIDIKEQLKDGYQGPSRPELNHLME